MADTAQAITHAVSGSAPAKGAHRVRVILCFLAIYIVWGSTYLAIRYAVETIPPLYTAGFRHLTAGSILLIWCLAKGMRPTWAHVRASVVIGFFFFLLGHGLLHWAEKVVPSGLASLLIAVEPIIVFLLSSAASRTWRLNGTLLSGILLGLAGVGVLVHSSGSNAAMGSKLGVTAVLAGALAWSIGIIYSRRSKLSGNPLLSSALSLLAGAAMLITVGTVAGEARGFSVAEVSTKSWLALGLEIAQRFEADLVSFSPDQVVQTWYEKALVPYVYTRLSRYFSFEKVNDPGKTDAAANGQFLLIRREVYERIGGHASVASEVLEDVALARCVKTAGCRIWFGSGKGIVRVRMYRSFDAMWQGWKKNLYQLIGGNPDALHKELGLTLSPIALAILLALIEGGMKQSILAAGLVLLVGAAIISFAYFINLARNGYASELAVYGFVSRILYAAVLWASYQSYRRGRLDWKGREYPVRTPDASNTGRNR